MTPDGLGSRAGGVGLAIGAAVRLNAFKLRHLNGLVARLDSPHKHAQAEGVFTPLQHSCLRPIFTPLPLLPYLRPICRGVCDRFAAVSAANLSPCL
jgi:hypothetical protein